jgi:DNA segregation ATPase FtsK/SpoIIIE, S-DNA-T family
VILFGRRYSPAILSTVSVLFALFVLSLGSLCLHAAGVAGFASALGKFLIEAFSWAGFFIPVYFLVGIVLLLARVFRRRSALLLMLSIVPFLTLSLIFHVTSKSTSLLPQIFLDSFGLIPSALLLFLLLALEMVLLFTLPFGGGVSTSTQKRPERNPLALPALSSDAPPRMPPDFDSDADPLGALLRSVSVPVETLNPPRDSVAPLIPDEPGAVDEPADFEASEELADPVDLVEPTDQSVSFADASDPIAAALVPAPAPEPAPLADEADDTDPPPLALDLTKASGVLLTPGPAQVELPFPKAGKQGKAYGIPVQDVLKNRGGNEYWIIDDETKRASKILTDALAEFNIDAEVTGIRKGPVITLFEVLPAPGVRVSKIANLSDNIALRLAAPSVRIVAPIPGRHAVGIEVPNRVRSIVSFKEMISLDVMQKSAYEIPLALGKDILGEAQVIDLIQTPHLLIGGATNSGKSVLVNSIICSILFRKSPDDVRLFLIDPKIVELKLYNGCPHLLTPVITDPKKAFQALQYCISEMERRYTLLDALGVRDIRSFNKKAKKEHVQKLPYIVIVIDEFADLMATTGKELESTLARLAAMARAIGIHMVLATQRPSIDVITGLIKANIPSRIAFMVANKFDSRIIIDAVGAEKLLGKGDMLFSAAWNPFPVRIQGAYIDDEETDAVTEYVKKLGPPQYIEDEVFFDDEETSDFDGEPGSDPLFERALEVISAQGKASASYLQRRLKVGYNRAARLVEEMEARGIVGPAQGSKPREIIHMPGKGS